MDISSIPPFYAPVISFYLPLSPPPLENSELSEVGVGRYKTGVGSSMVAGRSPIQPLKPLTFTNWLQKSDPFASLPFSPRVLADRAGLPMVLYHTMVLYHARSKDRCIHLKLNLLFFAQC